MALTAVSEGTHTAEFLLSEGNGQYSREAVTLAANQNLEAGAVLSENGGEYFELAPAAADGTEVAEAILYGAADTTDGNSAQVTIIARDAEVSDAALVYPDGITAAEKTTAIENLAAEEILVR